MNRLNKIGILTLLLFFVGISMSIAQTLSEIRTDQPGGDNDEYIEIAGMPGMALTCTVIIIGDSSTGLSGAIESAIDLTGNVIPASGYFVIAESTFSLGTADLTATLDFENSDNLTILLVEGFTGADGDDLDTNDDCVLDVLPWTSVKDAVAFVENVNAPPATGSDECEYASSLGFPTVGPPLPQQIYWDGTMWQVGNNDPAAGTDTPGAANMFSLTTGVNFFTNYTVSEAGGTATVCVSITNEDATNSTVATIDVSAPEPTLGTDYTLTDSLGMSIAATPFTVTFQAGVTDNQCFTVTGIDDMMVEGDEIATFTLTGATGGNMAAVGATTTATATITDNDFPSSTCVTPGALVITEIMFNSDGNESNGEYIEIYNTTGSAINLDGFELFDASTTFHTFTGGFMVMPNSYAVLARGTGAETCVASLPAGSVYFFSSPSLNNSSPEVVGLRCADQSLIDQVEYLTSGFPGSSNGIAIELDEANALSTTMNDDGANWCLANSACNGVTMNFGTPGSANTGCSAAPCNAMETVSGMSPTLVEASVSITVSAGTTTLTGSTLYDAPCVEINGDFDTGTQEFEVRTVGCTTFTGEISDEEK